MNRRIQHDTTQERTAYYACGADFPDTVPTCHSFGLADIGGTTLNAIHAVQKGINPYTIDIQGDYNSNSAYRGFRYWPMMFATYLPLASFFTRGWGAMHLTNFALDVITAALVGLLACRRSGWLCGVLAASIYLMLLMLPMRLYQMVDTDPAPRFYCSRPWRSIKRGPASQERWWACRFPQSFSLVF